MKTKIVSNKEQIWVQIRACSEVFYKKLRLGEIFWGECPKPNANIDFPIESINCLQISNLADSIPQLIDRANHRQFNSIIRHFCGSVVSSCFATRV